jgi:hypothetical protein
MEILFNTQPLIFTASRTHKNLTQEKTTMANPTRLEINCETGVESIIELTDAEVAQMEADRVAATERKAEEDAAAEALAALKASAKAKLVAGTPLTEEEAATLVI